MPYFKLLGLILVMLQGAVACSVLGSRPEAPIVSLADIKFSRMGFLEQGFTLTLRLKNPNNFSLPLRGLNYVVKLNGQNFAKGVSTSRVTIAPYKEATVNVDVVSNLLGLFKPLTRLSSGESLKYSLSGNVGVVNKAFKLPFSQEGEVTF
jgi:LEA14-like dessication related protein